MMNHFKTIYSKDLPNKKMKVTREFAAPLDKVWQAWTQKELLDQWWAPSPWKNKTKSLEFKPGGKWLYSMTGPDGTEMYSYCDYISIVPQSNFKALDGFCDNNGVKNNNFPSMNWDNTFTKTINGTQVVVEITYPTETDMQKIIEMGFEEGFAMGHNQLDKLLTIL